MLKTIVFFLLAIATITVAVNVGTALYDVDDATRETWTEDDVIMLRSRILMDHLIPKNAVDGSKFLEYVKVILKTTETIVSDRAREIAMVSAADAIGGYLRGVMLPRAKSAYYNGRESFQVTDQLHALFRKIKFILATDGRSWMAPEEAATGQPDTIVAGNDDDIAEETENACAALLLQDGEPATVPIPAFDDDLSPGTLVFPFAVGKRLFNVDRPWISGDDRRPLLVRYYRLAVGCTSSAPHQFRLDFHRWLERTVVPLLADHRQWYPVLAEASRVVRAAAKAAVIETEVSAGARHKRRVAAKTAAADDEFGCGGGPGIAGSLAIILASLWSIWVSSWALFSILVKIRSSGSTYRSVETSSTA